MAFRFNSATNQLEDENGNPAPTEGIPMDQLAGAQPSAQGAGPAPEPPPLIQKPSVTVSNGAPPPASAPGASVTSRLGGTTVQTPMGANDNVVQRTSGKTTTTKQIESPEEAGNQQHIENVNQQQEEQLRQAGKAGELRAQEEYAAATERARIERQKQLETEAAAKHAEAEIAKKTAIADDQATKWQSAADDAMNARGTFWARQDTGYKIKSGIAMVLGVIGGIGHDGQNAGVQAVEKAVNADEARFKDRLDIQSKVLDRARGDVGAARQKLKDQIDMISLRSAAAFDAAAADAEARGRRLGIDENNLKTNQGILDLRAKAADLRAKYLEGMRAKQQIESAQTVSTGTGKGAGHLLQANSEDTDKLANAANAVKSMDAAIGALSSTKGGAYKEFGAAFDKQRRMDQLASSHTGVGQIIGLARGAGVSDMTLADRMKNASPQAKQLMQSFEQMTEAIAKAAGGVITETDRESARKQIALAAVSSPEEAAKILMRERQKMVDKMNLALANKKYNIPSGIIPQGVAPPQAPPSAQGQIQIRTLKNGQRVKVRQIAPGQYVTVQ